MGVIWVISVVLGFFGFGLGRAIKLFYITRNIDEYRQRMAFAVSGLAITAGVAVFLLKSGYIAAEETNDWRVALICMGPFVFSLFGSNDTLHGDQ